jgi:DNA-binding NtrC family response regulator
MPELVLFSGDKAVLRCPLHGQTVTVGKSPANDISIPDASAPPLLCSFEPLTSGGYRVLARGGKALVVDGAEGDEHALADGARIDLGRLVARYDAAEPAPPPRKAGQRTGILKRAEDGSLTRADLHLLLPESLGGQRLPIPPEGLRVGASDENDVVIDDGFVSSFHAQLFVRGERVFVRDLDSTNGTFLEGVRVIEAEIRPGATLQLGEAALQVEPVDAPEAVDPVTGDGPWTCDELVTCDAAFAEVFTVIDKVAQHDATVCVFGETGTGKELVGRALHVRGGRAGGPFVALNCAALPASLIEAELFGHEKGAFTGADRARAGVFEQADGGTLFLDEIGELPLEMQAKLLRVLEERRVRRIGGRADLAVDARIVAATHRDLVAHVREGRFREDLLHRLYVIPLRLPPLRARTADIAFLARHLARRLSPEGRDVVIEAAAAAKLKTHPFPGNVRELRNVVQRALILGDGARITEGDVDFLPPTIDDVTQAAEVYRRGMTMEDIERDALAGALASWPSAAEAARALGMPKTTFWRRATALGLLSKQKG